MVLLEPHTRIPELPKDAFVECRGKIAKLSANYTEELARLVWDSVLPDTERPAGHDDTTLEAGIKEMPQWSVLITRKIPLKSEEAKSAKALAAIDKELSGHRARKTWDEQTVREYKELARDNTKAEVMTGRIFGILGKQILRRTARRTSA